MFEFDFTKAIINFSDFDFSQLGDALLFGGSMLAIGMLTIFSVLFVLWLCITCFKIFIHDLPKKIKKKKKAAPVVIMPEREEVEETADESELIAVITAAIAMAESDNSGMNFRVVSFKRV